MKPWPAADNVIQILEKVKSNHKRLKDANIAVCFEDTKPFIRGSFNLGKTTKFSDAHKLWHADQPYDFLITLSSDAWDILSSEQKEAWLDFRLCCCQAEMVPEEIEENGKKKPVKDKWGRIVYTDVVKTDDDGNPKWKSVKADIAVIQDNIARYGCWSQDFVDLKSAIKQADLRKSDVQIEQVGTELSEKASE